MPLRRSACSGRLAARTVSASSTSAFETPVRRSHLASQRKTRAPPLAVSLTRRRTAVCTQPYLAHHRPKFLPRQRRERAALLAAPREGPPDPHARGQV